MPLRTLGMNTYNYMFRDLPHSQHYFTKITTRKQFKKEIKRQLDHSGQNISKAYSIEQDERDEYVPFRNTLV